MPTFSLSHPHCASGVAAVSENTASTGTAQNHRRRVSAAARARDTHCRYLPRLFMATGTHLYKVFATRLRERMEPGTEPDKNHKCVEGGLELGEKKNMTDIVCLTYSCI